MCIKPRLIAALLLSTILSCSFVKAEDIDFSYISFTSPPPTLLVNPKYQINANSTEKNLQIEIPSSITTPNETSNSEKEIIPEQNQVFSDIKSPLDVINDFFAPIAEEEVFDIVADKSETLDLNGYTISKVEFVGLKNVNPDLISANINAQAGSLFNQDMLQQDLQKIYSTGFFTDKMEIEPELEEDNTVRLKFVLQENLCVKDVRVMGNSTISDMELMPFVKPLKGMPQNVTNINQSIEQINNYYHSKGYILAAVDSITDDEDGILIIGINEGVINKIVFEGNEKTKDFVLARNVLTLPGTVYNEEYLKRDITKLYSTNIFEKVDRNIYPSPEVDGAYDIKITVKESPPNSLTIGGGIDNALGGFGSVTYSENNFLGRGQKLSLSGILGSGVLLSDASIKNRMNYQLELNFFEPYFLNADNSLAGKLYFRELGSYQIPLAIERRVGLMSEINHKIKGYDNLSTSFSTGIEHIHLKEGDFNKISKQYNIRGLDIKERSKELTGGTFINLGPAVKYNTLDTNINPREGVIATAKFMEALSIDDFKRTNGRLVGSVSKYFPVGEKSSFSLTGRGGIKVHGDDMPEVMAFRLGGPYSIRGFKMNGVGTGESFIMGSAELATPLPLVDKLKWDFIKTLRLTFFVDAGKVYDGTIASVLYDRPMSAISAGVGLRLYIPNVGPISVDYGIPLTNVGDYGSKNGYFTFGTGVNGMGW